MNGIRDSVEVDHIEVDRKWNRACLVGSGIRRRRHKRNRLSIGRLAIERHLRADNIFDLNFKILNKIYKIADIRLGEKIKLTRHATHFEIFLFGHANKKMTHPPTHFDRAF